MGAFLVPYLVRDYAHAYAMFNGAIGDKLDKEIQDKYKLKVLCFYDFGFRHFWTSKKPIIEPKDLRGAKIRVQQAKVFGDTINGLGGNAVPMGWGEVITAAKSGVIDGGDLPIVNMKALKVYEVSKYASMTYHNYGPTNVVMNLEAWNGLTPEQQKLLLDVSRETQVKIREATESVDNFAKAKSELEPLGMVVVEAKIEEFRKVAQQKIWPAYKSQYGAMWDEIEGFKV
jgi:TRAP-type C4-dicarboxylate transport system substrate-binding protein